MVVVVETDVRDILLVVVRGGTDGVVVVTVVGEIVEVVVVMGVEVRFHGLQFLSDLFK